jgi:hypothetical protein
MIRRHMRAYSARMSIKLNDIQRVKRLERTLPIGSPDCDVIKGHSQSIRELCWSCSIVTSRYPARRTSIKCMGNRKPLKVDVITSRATPHSLPHLSDNNRLDFGGAIFYLRYIKPWGIEILLVPECSPMFTECSSNVPRMLIECSPDVVTSELRAIL